MRNRFRSRSRSEGTPPLRTNESRKMRRCAGRNRNTSTSSDSDSERSSVHSRKRYSRLGSDRTRRRDRARNRSSQRRRRVVSSDTDRDRSCVRGREHSDEYRCKQSFRSDERRHSRSHETSMKETLNAIMSRLSDIEQRTPDTSSMPSQRDNTPQSSREPFVNATQALADTILKIRLALVAVWMSSSFSLRHSWRQGLYCGLVVTDMIRLGTSICEDTFGDRHSVVCSSNFNQLLNSTDTDSESETVEAEGRSTNSLRDDMEAGPSSAARANVLPDDPREDEAVPRDGAQSGEAV
ncbi:hypothetical protein RR48_11581 [Papilio machaon]|uniref:Uncharacterized protein n=1 Tax=Papilio machaon TaxID=76193 RepID=A0A194R508_PAPMA|nr:hypothetical protein RR48_11581 [Papilio machaon]